MGSIKKKTKFKIIITMLAVLILFNLLFYKFERTIEPTVIAVADAEARAKAVSIINQTVINEYSKEFNYDEIIHIDKDSAGNITLLKADTLKMNKIASTVALSSQSELSKMGGVGMKIPLGYIFQSYILSSFGPDIHVKIQPVGYIETNYISEFESAGINQTRHKILVQVKAKLRIIVPLKNNDIEVKTEVPIAETIIVGKIPNNAINLDLNSAGYKLKDKENNN